MKTIDMRGKSINEVISAFRKEHKIKDWELKYEVISQPSNGFLGMFGKKEAAVRFSLPSLEEKIKTFVEHLMAHMGITYENIKTYTEQKTIYITILKPSDAGFLIGKNGNMLEQLQYLVNRVFENVPYLERIYIDTEDYRYRQDMNFLKPFIPMISKVKTTGKSLTLEPMQPGERRIIHQYVERDRAIKTMTIGDGDKKRIVIMPSNQNNTDNRKQAGNENRKPGADTRKPAAENKKPAHEHRKPLPSARKPVEMKKNTYTVPVKTEENEAPVKAITHEHRKHTDDSHASVKEKTESNAPVKSTATGHKKHEEGSHTLTIKKNPSKPRKPVTESKKPAGELTPEQRASQALKRHNQAHHHAQPPQSSRKPERSGD